MTSIPGPTKTPIHPYSSGILHMTAHILGWHEEFVKSFWYLRLDWPKYGLIYSMGITEVSYQGIAR